MSESKDVSTDEKRLFPRVSQSCNLRFRSLDAAEVPGADKSDQDAVMKNISGGGISFSSPDPLPVGTMLAMEVDLPGFPTGVISMGRVVWCRESDAGHDVGVSFWWVGWKDESAQRKISEFITRALDEDG